MSCPIHGNIIYCEMADLYHHIDAVDQDELILCDLGVSHGLSSVEAMIVSAWHNAARKSRHQRWLDNDIQDTEFSR